MNLTKIVALSSLMALMSGCIVIASPTSSSRADLHTQKELYLDADMLKMLTVETGSGSLTILGEDGLKEIRATADIYTDKKHPESYQLSLTKSGSTAKFFAENSRTSGFWVGNSPHIDVVLHVPASLIMDIDDGSGEIIIENIQNLLTIKDGSGDITVKNIGNDVSIDDNSGGIYISQVNGSLDITDGSGELLIKDIHGNLTLDDSSGAIEVINITGNAKITDGSGELTVNKVSGMVTIDDGSGGINISDAGGLKIIDSGSGALKVNNIKGDFSIDS